MKKIFLTAIAVITMSCVAVYADNGKKPVSKKKAKTENCKKQNCPSTCNKTTCINMPGCICH